MTREQMDFVLATGYGRNSLDGLADMQMSELSCHAKGAAFLFPNVRTVVDIGGQDVKVIEIENGMMKNFVMNDKCAAGTGRFLDVMARVLEVKVEELGDLDAARESLRPDVPWPRVLWQAVMRPPEAVAIVEPRLAQAGAGGLTATVPPPVLPPCLSRARSSRPRPVVVCSTACSSRSGSIVYRTWLSVTSSTQVIRMPSQLHTTLSAAQSAAFQTAA